MHFPVLFLLSACVFSISHLVQSFFSKVVRSCAFCDRTLELNIKEVFLGSGVRLDLGLGVY